MYAQMGCWVCCYPLDTRRAASTARTLQFWHYLPPCTSLRRKPSASRRLSDRHPFVLGFKTCPGYPTFLAACQAANIVDVGRKTAKYSTEKADIPPYHLRLLSRYLQSQPLSLGCATCWQCFPNSSTRYYCPVCQEDERRDMESLMVVCSCVLPNA